MTSPWTMPSVNRHDPRMVSTPFEAPLQAETTPHTRNRSEILLMGVRRCATVLRFQELNAIAAAITTPNHR